MHDPRLGRFFAVDPLFKKYPWNSSYAFAENKVIQFVELEGLEVGAQPAQLTKNGWTTAINAVRSGIIPELIEQRLTADYPTPSLASQLFPLPTGGGQGEISLGISKKGFGLAVGTDSDGNLSLKSEFKNAGLKITMDGEKEINVYGVKYSKSPSSTSGGIPFVANYSKTVENLDFTTYGDLDGSGRQVPIQNSYTKVTEQANFGPILNTVTQVKNNRNGEIIYHSTQRGVTLGGTYGRNGVGAEIDYDIKGKPDVEIEK